MPTIVTAGAATAGSYGWAINSPDPYSYDALLVAGGGGGGAVRGAGGGAGGVNYYGALSTNHGSTYSYSVGTGGAGATASTARGTNGGNTTYSIFNVTGGGGGGSTGTSVLGGNSGGSGGGSAGASGTAGGAGTVGQGNAGGNAAASGTPSGAGGGGFSAVGGTGTAGSPGQAHTNVGGAGYGSLIHPLFAAYGGGGGGGGYSGSTTGSFGWGGLGGGGNGGSSPYGGNTATLCTQSGTTLTVPANSVITVFNSFAPVFYQGWNFTGFTNTITISAQLTALNTASATTSAVGLNGANYITVSSNTGIVVGQFVGNNITGIPTNTFVRGINGTVIELSNKLTASVLATVSFFTPGLQGTYTVSPSQTGASSTLTPVSTTPINGADGVQYTGGGGGGGGGNGANGGKGGDGCVIIRYPSMFTQPTITTTTGTYTVTTYGIYNIYLLTGSGTVKWNQ